MFALKEDCLRTIDGEVHIEFTTWKTKNEPVSVVRPANVLVVDAIHALKEHTKELRKQSGLPYLFLTKDWNKGTNIIRVPNYSMWGTRRLRLFFKRNNLYDGKGNPLHLTMHHFRHIFATYAIKSGMAIHEVMEALNHKSASMTEVYIDAGDYPKETMRKVLSGEIVISSTNQNVVECIESRDNPFKGTTTDQAEKLRRATKIEILPHGFCLHHPLRGEPCAQDGVCLGYQYFLVSADRLAVFEARLWRVNEELDKNSDTSIYTSKLNYQKQRLGFYVSDLQAKIAANKMLQGMQEGATDATRS
ncbi:site-specific integrase [Aneurinibacillus migulanus]|uniref:site-specific integrase n=1 Tax=Aneurinibacillus migulanus TaxID=47500 RepID=UPI002286580E|nr:site-specific integrase [Aneurinibacillus migulanus]